MVNLGFLSRNEIFEKINFQKHWSWIFEWRVTLTSRAVEKNLIVARSQRRCLVPFFRKKENSLKSRSEIFDKIENNYFMTSWTDNSSYRGFIEDRFALMNIIEAPSILQGHLWINGVFSLSVVVACFPLSSSVRQIMKHNLSETFHS